MSRNVRIAVLVCTVAAAVVAVLLAAGSGSEKSSSERARYTSGHPYIYVVDGKPRDGIQTLTYKPGQHVIFTVVSDVPDQVHVHGYDYKGEIRENGRVTFGFRATRLGEHVVELEEHGEQIAKLEVR
jgi:hypothetical protein